MSDCEPSITKNSSLYRDRNTMKVGSSQEGDYRGVFILYPKSEISKALVLNGYTANHDYTALGGVVKFTTTPNSKKQDLTALLLPFDSGLDETVTWFKPSETKNKVWSMAGGDITQLALNTKSTGVWRGNTVTFDITPFVSLWRNSGSDYIPILIDAPPSSTGITEMYSITNPEILIGNDVLLNCSFIRGGQTQAFSSEGVRVVMYHDNGNTAVEIRDDSVKGQRVWQSLLNTISTGNSFSVSSPDTEQGYILGNVNCTLVNKNCEIMFLSGISLPVSGEYYTTLEFSGISIVEEGVGILQIASPNAKTIADLAAIKEDDEITVKYTASVFENNARTFSVNFTSDETLKMNRYRIYLKQIPYSENRTGKPTELVLENQAPSVKFDLLVY